MHPRSIGTLMSFSLLISSNAIASQGIPQKTGFSGFVGFGIGSNTLKSNMINGTSLNDFDNQHAKNLGSSPSSETEDNSFFTGEVRYTWGDYRTQVFAGNYMEDPLRYDLATQIGIRQEIDNNGIIGFSYLFSAFPTQVFDDPYQTGAKRSDTDQTYNGFRASWSSIMGSAFDAKVTMREVDVDNERSGSTLGLSNSERRSLRRDGDDTAVEALYRWSLDKGHTIAPAIRYTDRDRDGGAMRSEEIGIELNYFYTASPRWNLAAKMYVGEETFDKRNPIAQFGNRHRDDDIIGYSVTSFYNEPMGLKQWRAMATASYYESDSNISFYDSKVQNFTLGMIYDF